MPVNKKSNCLSLFFLLLLFGPILSLAQTTKFKYQGALTEPDGQYDFVFELFDAPAGGNKCGPKNELNAIEVTGGNFAVTLDFGAAAFPGADRFLEIQYRPAGTSQAFSAVSPRPQIMSAPYTIRSLNAANADAAANSSQLGGTAASQFVQTGDARLSDDRNPLPNSPNYIQNTTAPQASSNLNISGNGTAGGTLSANVVNATTQYNIGGNRILSIPGFSNLFAGFNAGQSNTTGSGNAFFGTNAGSRNTSGGDNAFFGNAAGHYNTSGYFNAFFGSNAGINALGNNNSFFGGGSGGRNSGNLNAFFGYAAGNDSVIGNNNTLIGAWADTFGQPSNATAIGNMAIVYRSNSLVLGSIKGLNSCTPTFGCDSVNVGIGTVWPSFKLEVVDSSNTGLRVQTTQAGGTVASFGGNGAFNIDAPGIAGGRFSVLENGNVGVGTNAPLTKLHVSGTGIVRARINSDSYADLALTLNNLPGWSLANVSGGHFRIFNDALGQNAVWISNAGNKVGIGTTAPGFKLHVTDSSNTGLRVETLATGGTLASFGGNGAFQVDAPGIGGGRLMILENGNVGIGTSAPNDRLEVNGILRVSSLGLTGVTPLCRNGANQISNCSSSLRYKINVAPFAAGLSLVSRLRPITFDWKDGGDGGEIKDVGFGAEDVAKINPLFVNYNEKGEVEGVKYDRLSVVFVNALKEQQQIIERQQRQIDALIKHVCQINPGAEVCKEKQR
jgi:hypothetical protein